MSPCAAGVGEGAALGMGLQKGLLSPGWFESCPGRDVGVQAGDWAHLCSALNPCWPVPLHQLSWPGGSVILEPARLQLSDGCFSSSKAAGSAHYWMPCG